MTNYADLEKRLRENAGLIERDLGAPHFAEDPALFREAADALAALTEALRAAHKIAVDKAFERDRSGQPDGKMQGATAAVIANDILAICHGVGVDLSRARPGQDDALLSAASGNEDV